MKKPWQIWSVFLFCLSGLVLAMLWLSFKTIKLDAARENDRVETELVRRQAELQERISSALYRMDLKLLPLVSQEASRPHYLYKSFYKTSIPTPLPSAGRGNLPATGRNTSDQSSGGGERTTSSEPLPEVSPLLFETPEFVLLHFQVLPDGMITSPQNPVDNDLKLVNETIGQEALAFTKISKRMDQVKTFCNYKALLDWCTELKPTEIVGDIALQQEPEFSQNMYSVPAVEKAWGNLASQSEDSRTALQEGSRSKVAQQQQLYNNRASIEFNLRRDSTRQVASQGGNTSNFSQLSPRSSLNASAQTADQGFVLQGVMQPIWIGNHLILFRRIEGKGEPFFQCCWLDWEQIQTALKKEVQDLLPEVGFEPVKANTRLNIGTALTTLPVQLVIDSQKLLSTLSLNGNAAISNNSGLEMALLLSWLGLGLAAAASALLLSGVMKLSERRASFVSAVTHELRTPLTTFRMYSEMLAEQMVPPNKQQEYANTLKLQADRLSHLVENVLQFARLERSSAKLSTETVIVSELFERFSSRLAERTDEAELRLTIEVDETVADTLLKTQPASIEQVLFNLVDNACKYARPSSKNLIEVECQPVGKMLQFSVRDYGPGVAPNFKKTMFQPFSKSDLEAANSAPGVGLGLALCQRMARSLGGRLFHHTREDGAIFILEIPKT